MNDDVDHVAFARSRSTPSFLACASSPLSLYYYSSLSLSLVTTHVTPEWRVALAPTCRPLACHQGKALETSTSSTKLLPTCCRLSVPAVSPISSSRASRDMAHCFHSVGDLYERDGFREYILTSRRHLEDTHTTSLRTCLLIVCVCGPGAVCGTPTTLLAHLSHYTRPSTLHGHENLNNLRKSGVACCVRPV